MLKLEFNNDIGEADLVATLNGHSTDDPLETSVLISLHTNRRAEEGDVPEGVDKQGYWADAFRERKIGSRLWTLIYVKQKAEALSKAKLFTEEALQWLLDDGIAETIRVTATNPVRTVLLINIEITKPGDLSPRLFGPWSFLYGA